MSMVKQIAGLRDELADADVRARRAAESRDRAREELQKCAAELIVAQENTASAMAIAERHAAERDAALGSVSEHRAMLEALNGLIKLLTHGSGALFLRAGGERGAHARMYVEARLSHG